MRTLTSNGSPIPFAPRYFGELQASDGAVLDAAALRTRYREDGYVLLRNAIPAEMVWTLREAYLRLFPEGFVKNGEVRRGAFGRTPAALPEHGVAGHPAHAFVRSDSFRAFVGADIFRRIAEIFFDGPATLIRRTPLRHFVPGSHRASRAHLDRTYIDGVPAEVVTIWVPLGDCAMDAGSLLYLEGSHRDADLEARVRGEAPQDRPSDPRPLTHDLKWLADLTGRRWLTTDFEAGDVVVHAPTIVHASLDAESELMRVSTDIRFRRAGSPADPRWNDDWSADDGY